MQSHNECKLSILCIVFVWTPMDLENLLCEYNKNTFSFGQPSLKCFFDLKNSLIGLAPLQVSWDNILWLKVIVKHAYLCFLKRPSNID